jgi:hypothetical protein
MPSEAAFAVLRSSHVDSLYQMVVTLQRTPWKIDHIMVARTLKDLSKNMDRLRDAGRRSASMANSVIPACFETRCDVLKVEIRRQSEMIKESRFRRVAVVALLESFLVHIGRLTVEVGAQPFAEDMDSEVDVLDLDWETMPPCYKEVDEIERSFIQNCWRHLNSTVSNCQCSQCEKRRSRLAPLAHHG